MKKYFIVFGAIVISLLLMSTVTAVPQVHSNSIMNVINNIEDSKNSLENIIKINIFEKLKLNGLIELLIQLIMLIIDFVTQIISIVQNIISLANLIQNLINAFTTLFQLIQQLIELIQEIFNPQPSLKI